MTKKKKRKKLKYFLFGIVALIILLVAGRKAGWIGKENTPEVLTEKARTRTIIETVSASGKLQPAWEIRITADVSGEIIALPVKEGAKVQKDDLLVKIRPDNYEASADRAEAALNKARANLENARSQLIQAKAQYENARIKFQRNQRLFEKQAISRSEFEKIRADYQVKKAQVDAARQSVEAAKYNVKSARADLRSAQENLEKTIIRAPASGTISRLNVEPGERVVGTAQMEGTEIMRIADLNSMDMEVEVSENDIIRISEGDTALIELDAFLENRFKGVVTQLANSARSDNNATDQASNFPVSIRLKKASYKNLIDSSKKIPTPFRPGMSGIAEIRTKKASNVITVPVLAVTTRRVSSTKKNNPTFDREPVVVFIFRENLAIQRAVRTGIQDDRYMEIKKGIEPGTEVISGPYQLVSKTLNDSQRVHKKSTGK